MVQVCDDSLLLKSCQPSTPAARILKWRSLLRDAIVDSIDKIQAETVFPILRDLSN